jgi:hypothetical protein
LNAVFSPVTKKREKERKKEESETERMDAEDMCT